MHLLQAVFAILEPLSCRSSIVLGVVAPRAETARIESNLGRGGKEPQRDIELAGQQVSVRNWARKPFAISDAASLAIELIAPASRRPRIAK